MITDLPHKHSHAESEHFLIQEMPEKEDFQIVADVFKLLNDPNRLQIFWVLCHAEECVINLAVILQISSPNLSHHLKLLKASNLLPAGGRVRKYTTGRPTRKRYGYSTRP